MTQLTQIDQVLKTLTQQAEQLDHQRGEHHQPLFDERLFSCRSKLLLPCAEEARGVFETLKHEQQEGHLTALSAEYLAEHLLDQISAISRELSTQAIRKNEIKHSSYYRKPINFLYQKLAQHQEWERRLREMVQDKKRALETAPPWEEQQANKALVKTEQRLIRCQAAKIKLEKQINYREKNQ